MRNIPVSSRLNSAKERSPFLRAYASCNPQILLCFRLGENMHMRANATEIITVSYILCALESHAKLHFHNFFIGKDPKLPKLSAVSVLSSTSHWSFCTSSSTLDSNLFWELHFGLIQRALFQAPFYTVLWVQLGFERSHFFHEAIGVHFGENCIDSRGGERDREMIASAENAFTTRHISPFLPLGGGGSS